MKTFLPFLLAVWITTGLLAQQHPVSLDKTNQFEKMVQPYPGVFSTRETKWVQDSSYYYLGDSNNDDGWVLKNRYMVAQRDSMGNATNSFYHFYDDATGMWTNAINTSITYYPNNNEHTYFDSPWNSDTQTWNDTSTFYNFNEDGIQTLLIYKTWDFSNNHFTNGYRRVYDKVADSTFYEFKSYNLNMNSNLWELSFHEKHYFDEENKDTLVLQQVWINSSNTWYNIAKFFISYENGLNTSTLVMNWDNQLNIWTNQTYTQYTYNVSGDIETISIQLWESDSSCWVNSQDYHYYYNDLGKIDSLIESSWNSDENSWEYYLREVTTYENDSTVTIRQLWNNDTQQWEYSYRKITVNDEQGFMTNYTYQTWNNETGNWKNNSKYDFFWSEIEVHGIDEETVNKVTIYPNPASETITVLSPLTLAENRMDIYSVTGQLINTVQTNGNYNTIDISELPPGIYFIRFNTRQGIVTKVFIKR